MLERFLATVGDPHFLGRDLADGWVNSSQSAWSEMTSGSSTLRWRARWRIRIQPEAMAVIGSAAAATNGR